MLTLLELLGAATIVAGVALVSIPAALIVGGVLAIGFAIAAGLTSVDAYRAPEDFE